MNKIYRFTLILLVIFTACEMRVKRVVRIAPAGPGNYKIYDYRAYDKIYITGSFEPSSGQVSCITAKYNAQLQLQWFTEYKPRNAKVAEGKSLMIIPPGPYDAGPELFVLAQIVDSTGINNLILIKYDTLGNSLFEKLVERSAGAITGGLLSGYGDRVDVVGYASENNDTRRIFIHQFLPSGDSVITRIYRYPELHFSNLKWARSSGNGFLAGGIREDMNDIFYIRFNSLGEFQAISRYENPEIETGLIAIKIDAKGDIVMTATSAGEKTGKDFLTVVFGPGDKPLWACRYDGPAHKDDIPKDMIIDDRSFVYVTGKSMMENGQDEIATLSYDCEGNEKWTERYPGSNNWNAEPYFFEPFYTGTTFIGQHDRAPVTLAGTVGDKTLILKYKMSGALGSLTYGKPNRICQPTGLTTRFLLLSIKSGDRLEALIMSYGPFEIPGIKRWD